MTTFSPSIEFFVGLSENLSDAKLRRGKDTGTRSVLMIFKSLKALEKFQSFTQQTYGDLRLIDEEGTISIQPSAIRFVFGGKEGEDVQRVECTLEIQADEDWERVMRFLKRYAEANGMGYQEK